ncbi:MAG: hypothetical protein IIZ22_03390 [Clostridia bacterium]|nr:hypothetical protein [Clostridia bacterium]
MKKSIKTIIALIFCLTLILTMFTACGGTKGDTPIKTPDGVPEVTIDPTLLTRFGGDWNGCFMFVDCTGKYEDFNGEIYGALCRVNVDGDGKITLFIGVDVEDTPFEDLVAEFADGEITYSGKWANATFENAKLHEVDGTLSTLVKVEKESGNLGLAFNFRRLDDEGWTNEEPGFSESQINACKGKSFDELASMIGYSKGDYPEGTVVTSDTTEAPEQPAAESGALIGSWTYPVGDYTYTFNKDGTGSYSAGSTVMEFTYTDKGTSVEILYTGNTVANEFKYTIKGNVLSIEDSFGEKIEYIKK